MNWTLLHKYLSGECKPEELQKVEDWLHADVGNQRLLSSLKKIWDIRPSDEIEVDAVSAWSSFQQKIASQRKGEKKRVYKLRKLHPEPPVRKTYSRSIVMFLSAAAVIIIAFIFARQVSVGDNASQIQSQLVMQEVVTTKGQRTTFRLSDGTRVQLNADSRIEIPGAFMDSTRKVYLEGEAYFEVVHNPKKPFVVYSGEAYTRVLGTKFGIRAYSEDDKVQVVVTEGKVALGSEKQLAEQKNKQVVRNQIGILSKDGQTHISNVGNIQRYVGWKDGKLVFDDTSFGEVKHQLERWFDITCIIADSSLIDRRVTATFNGEPMAEVLNVITLAMDMKYEQEGRRIIFRM